MTQTITTTTTPDAFPSTVTIAKTQLGDQTQHLGELIGLLTAGSGSYSDDVVLHTDWFANTLTELEAIPERVAALIQVIEDYFGDSVKDHPSEPDTESQWFAIPNIKTGKPTGLYLVTPAAAADAGDFGIGCYAPYNQNNLSIEPFFYLPLFTLSTSSPQWLLSSASHACKLGLSVKKDDGAPFNSQTSVTFDSLIISADIFLADQNPGFTVEFTNLAGQTPGEADSYSSLSALKASSDAQAWLDSVISVAAPWLNQAVADAKIAIGDLLIVAKLLKQSADSQGGSDYQLDLSELEGSAQAIALNMLQAVLVELSAEANNPVVEVSNGGIYFVADPSTNSTDYGLRIGIEDITVIEASGDEGSKPKPGGDLQLGKWLLDESDAGSWVARSLGLTDPPAPGVTVTLLNASGTTYRFKPQFALISLGFDVEGGDQAPLFDISGYTLQGGELRGYLVGGDSGFSYGFGASLDGLGLPLGPSFGDSISDDKVAESLLSSSNSDNDNSNDAVNPAFSLSAAWVRSGNFEFQLYDANGDPANSVWMPMQRTFGPLHCRKLGLGWVQSDTLLSLLFDGSVDLDALDVDLQGLSIGVPITSPGDLSKYALNLEGLGITLNGDEVQISGDLAKMPADSSADPPRDWIEYDGDAMVTVGNLALAALGSYAYVGSGSSGYASLFLFAILDEQLGDPTGTGALYITGLSGGFGFNRSIILPAISAVSDFPLVAAAQDPAALGATQDQDGNWIMPSAGTALLQMEQYLPPERGEYWFAAGLRFTSFDLINSNALFTFSIGNTLEIGILGLSWSSMPPPSAPGAAEPAEVFAYAELEIEVKILPENGSLNATAVLTPNSFVIDPACQLSGSYAFYSWFGDSPHSGQFVMTLGGYHPDFTPPAYFPKVPRLAFNWPLSGDVTIHGDAYYALTPSAVMAGGGLEILFHSGDLKAWFTAEMNALIVWAPFHFEIGISVRIGVSYRLHLLFLTKTYKLELGANLSLWGPKTGGKAHVNWTIISFTVNFGAPETSTAKTLAWTDANGNGFAQTLLPHSTGSSSDSMVLSAAQSGTQPTAPYSISAGAGVTSTATETNDGDQVTVWIVRADQLQWTVLTTIPCTAIDLANDGASTVIQSSSTSIDVRPMDCTLSASVLTITLYYQDDSSNADLGTAFNYQVTRSAVPAAKWGAPLPSGSSPDPNQSVDDQLMGIAQIQVAAPPLSPSGSDALDIDLDLGFGYDPVEDSGNNQSSPHPSPLNPDAAATGWIGAYDADAVTTITDTIGTESTDSVATTRGEVFTTLRGWGINPGGNDDLDSFAASPDSYLDGTPLIVKAVA